MRTLSVGPFILRDTGRDEEFFDAESFAGG